MCPASSMLTNELHARNLNRYRDLGNHRRIRRSGAFLVGGSCDILRSPKGEFLDCVFRNVYIERNIVMRGVAGRFLLCGFFPHASSGGIGEGAPVADSGFFSTRVIWWHW